METFSCPVIVNTALATATITKTLEIMKYKVKISHSTATNSILFPKSAVSFLIYQLKDLVQKWPLCEENILSDGVVDQQVLARVRSFASVNRSTHLVVISALFGKFELKVLAFLQAMLMESGIAFLMAHHANECVDVITTLSRINSKEVSETFMKRIDLVSKSFIPSYEYAASALASLGLSKKDILLFTMFGKF